MMISAIRDRVSPFEPGADPHLARKSATVRMMAAALKTPLVRVGSDATTASPAADTRRARPEPGAAPESAAKVAARRVVDMVWRILRVWVSGAKCLILWWVQGDSNPRPAD
jgi:hypothetical protein